MKKKKLKKMLAVMLAAMTVSATPGLVGAIKPESKKIIIDLNTKLKDYESSQQIDPTQALDELKAIAKEDDDAKVEVSKTLGNMIDEFEVLIEFKYNPLAIGIPLSHIEDSPKNLSKIISIFNECSKYSGAKETTAIGIEKMANHNFFGQYEYVREKHMYRLYRKLCSPEQLDNIINIFKTCLKDGTKETKQHIFAAISAMSEKGVFGRKYKAENKHDLNVRKYEPKQISQIMKILNNFSEGNEEYVASAISSMEKRQLLGEYTKDDILKILKTCSNNKKSGADVAETIRSGIIYNNRFDQNSSKDVLDILQKCAEGNEIEVSDAICEMVLKKLIDENLIDKTLDILKSCSCPKGRSYESRSERDNVSTVMDYVIQAKLINDKNSRDKVLDILQICSESSIEYVLPCLESMATRNLIDESSRDKVLNLLQKGFNIEMFNRCYGEISQIINSLTIKDLLKSCKPNQINQIIDSLVKCLKNGSEKDASDAIKAMKAKNLLNAYTPNNIPETLDSLIPHLQNDETRNATITIIEAMAKSGALSQCTPDQAKQIVDSLKGYLKNKPNAENDENVAKISNILKACSEFDAVKIQQQFDN